MLKRNMGVSGITGLQTPPETESIGSQSEVGDDAVASTGVLDGASTEKGPEDRVPAPIPERDVQSDAFIANALENLELD